MRHLALLRGINVGGNTQLAMEPLRELFGRLGHEDVRTHLRTGNVVFTPSGDVEPSRLATEIEKRVADDLGVRTTVLVRTADEIASVIDANPLAVGDVTKLHVTFLADAPQDDRTRRLDGLPAGGEEFALVGREVYLYCPNGYGRTKLSNANLERRLGVTATTRTWRVVSTLHDMLNARM